MAAFINLEDSPMFQKQIFSLEGTSDELKDRCQRLYKGVKKFIGALGEASSGVSAFADSLEEFGAGHDDPISVSIGGPVLSKFINTLRELSTYKEFLRSQVEHVLLERLTTFMTVDLQEAKESRRRFDKAVHSYDQVIGYRTGRIVYKKEVCIHNDEVGKSVSSCTTLHNAPS